MEIEYFIPAWSSFTYSLVLFHHLVLNILVSCNVYKYFNFMVVD